MRESELETRGKGNGRGLELCSQEWWCDGVSCHTGVRSWCRPGKRHWEIIVQVTEAWGHWGYEAWWPELNREEDADSNVVLVWWVVTGLCGQWGKRVEGDVCVKEAVTWRGAEEEIVDTYLRLWLEGCGVEDQNISTCMRGRYSFSWHEKENLKRNWGYQIAVVDHVEFQAVQQHSRWQGRVGHDVWGPYFRIE